MSVSPVERAAEAFATELARWRVDRGMTKKQLAARMGFDPSYISHIEGRRHRPTEDFARRAEAVLNAGGSIWRRFQEFDEARQARGPVTLLAREPAIPTQWLPPGTGLVVELEEAQLTYRDGMYYVVVRRALYNAGNEPVTRYLVRVAVDRYPGQPARSNEHHRSHPLSIEELELTAYCGEPGVAEQMVWRAKQDRDAYKEIWLLFENADGRFPLYPGERTALEYRYQIPELKWGSWFERAVRLPTRRLVVQMRFPGTLDPQVWGVETSMAAEEAPLRTPITREHDGDMSIFTWRTDDPSLNARFQLQWRWRGQQSAPPAQAA
jgi:transcriptional regulator with XRE-family HTH domain